MSAVAVPRAGPYFVGVLVALSLEVTPRPGGMTGWRPPWLALVVFAGFVSILTLLPGQVDFLGTMYSFGAMLSFTIAHLALVTLRVRDRDAQLVFNGRPNLPVRGIEWPLFGQDLKGRSDRLGSGGDHLRQTRPNSGELADAQPVGERILRSRWPI